MCIHICIGIELLADLRALDESDLEIFGFDADTAAALWLELEQLPQVYIICMHIAATAGIYSIYRERELPQVDGMLSSPSPKPQP